MALKVTKADASHYQYFKKDVLEEGAGYIVSSSTALVGLFSFLFDGDNAKLSFTFVFDQEAILLAVKTFLEDYPNIKTVQYMGNQNLSKIGFKQKIYTRG